MPEQSATVNPGDGTVYVRVTYGYASTGGARLLAYDAAGNKSVVMADPSSPNEFRLPQAPAALKGGYALVIGVVGTTAPLPATVGATARVYQGDHAISPPNPDTNTIKDKGELWKCFLGFQLV
jgi:outer membrane protein assembly factor BamB